VALPLRVALLRRHGRASQAYSATYHEGIEHFGDEHGFIAYKQVGRSTLVLSDPIAPPDRAAELISRFLEKHRDVSFWYLSGSTAKILAARGFTINAMGHDTIIDLKTYTFEGGKKETLRRGINRMVKRGFTTRESTLTEVGLDKVRAMSDAWRQSRTIRNDEVAFLNRPLVLMEEPDVRRFFTFDGEGKLVAFGFFDPLYEGGEIVGYMSQHNRHLQEADSMVHFGIKRVAIETFQKEGRKVLNLGLALLADVLEEQEFKANSSWITARYFNFSFNNSLVNRYIYPLKGILAHRRAFRGEQQWVYFAFNRRPVLPRILKMMRASKVF
jgi:phosphatidylglycerol lysyltransferase